MISNPSRESMAGECKVLRFFRPLPPNFSTKLFLPAHLAEHITRGRSRDKVTLVSPQRETWHADLHIENKEMFFGGESWQTFAQDNDLEIGQLLFFKYKANMVFSFRIFDVNDCERVSRKEIIDVDTDQNSHSNQEQAANKKDKSKSELIAHCNKKRRAEEDQIMSKAEQGDTSNKKKRGKEHLNTSKSTRDCTRAYFETTIRPFNLKHRWLNVPAGFRKSSGLTGKFTGLEVQNSSRGTWFLGLTHGNSRISKGWPEFVRSNQLKDGDKVVFESVSAEGNLMQLKMIKLLDS